MQELIKAVNEVMKAAKSVSKNSTVGAGRSQYKGVRDIDVKQLIQPLMAKNGLAVFQTGIEVITESETWEQQYNGQTQRKKQVFTEVKCTYKLIHDSGQYIDLSSLGYGVDSQDKGAGKAMTYALKMLLLYTFLIPSGEIDDTDATHSEDYEKPQKQKVPKPTVKKETSKPKETESEKKARFLTKTIAAITHSKLDEDQKEVLAEVILWLPKEEMKPWLGVINNWGNDGVVEMIAEVNGLKLLEATQRRDKLNNLQSNQIPF